MTVVSGIVLYVIVWWVVVFAVLPWGVRTAAPGDPGAEHGAPANPQLWRKLIWTSVIAGLIWLVIFALIEADLFSFRDWARQQAL
jgi:predicted secreted protein